MSEHADEFIEMVRELIALHGGKQAALSRAIGIPQSTISKWLSQTQKPALENIRAIERALEDRKSSPKSKIPVYGYVGLGEEIEWLGEGGQVLEETDFPLLLNNPDIFALIGRGNSMAPLVHDGDIVIGKRPDGRLPGEFVGRKAIVKVADGPYLLKVIRRGSQPDRWNLESINQLYETRENEVIEHLAEYVGSFQRGIFGLR